MAILDVGLHETVRIFLSKERVQIFPCLGQPFVARKMQRIVLDANDSFDIRHHLFVKILPNDVAHKKQFSFRVIHDVMNVVSLELAQNGNDHGSIGQSGKKCDAPR